MPYIAKVRAEQLHRRGFATTGAELNYIITYHVARFLRERRATGNEVSYAELAEVLAALEGAKGEFERRVMHRYEDGKVVDAARRDERVDPYAPVLAKLR
jgi:hypothetical protein